MNNKKITLNDQLILKKIAIKDWLIKDNKLNKFESLKVNA